MARKKKHPEHVNHERWLISYADFITLLFAFFVVMFASSQVDSRKVGRFTESFSKAVGIDVFPTSGSSLLSGADSNVTAVQAQPAAGDSMLPAELQELRVVLERRAHEHGDVNGVQVLARRNELVLRLADTLIFDSGNDTMRPESRKVLHAIAAELKSRSVSIRVEGHTDDNPIATFRFPSNWELSTARATAVIRALARDEELPPERLSAAGYGQFHPIAPNATEGGRAQNRRVDLVITPFLPLESATDGGTEALAEAHPDAAPPIEEHAAPVHEEDAAP